MTHFIWYRASLTCLACGRATGPDGARMWSSGVNPDIRGGTLAIGEVIEMERGDFEIGYERVGTPLASDQLQGLETWSCPHCRAPQYAVIVFAPLSPRSHRLVSISVVAATPELAPHLDGASDRAIQELRDTGGDSEKELLVALGLATR